MNRSGWTRQQGRYISDMQSRLDRIDQGGTLPTVTVSGLSVTLDSLSSAINVKFQVVSLQGLEAVVLMRNTTQDTGTAQAIQTTTASQLLANAKAGPWNVAFSDANPGSGSVYYWVKVIPNRNKRSGSYFEGPQFVASGLAGGVPAELLAFDASEAPGPVSGTVTISVNCWPADSSFFSLKVYATGYQGKSYAVAVAQQQQTSFSFTMLKTAETITLTGVAVEVGGAEAPFGSAPTRSLTLNGTATDPCQVERLSAAELTTGVQIGFAANPDTVTQYKVYRGPRGGGFGGASQIGTVTPSGSAAYTYLDTAGLGGVYEWYVVAHNSVGDSSSSKSIYQNQIYTSADLPPNAPGNSTNYATVDSIDAGSNATIRVYGTGGVGTSWTAQFGYGSATYPSASLTGYAYTTKYWVLYNTQSTSYVVTASFPSTMPDGLVFAGSVTTCASGGGGGTGGGGGGTGGGHGGCVERGTPVEYPAGTSLVEETELPCGEWICFAGEGGAYITVHPDTLVSVWKRAKDLELGDLLDSGDEGEIQSIVSVTELLYAGVKVKRRVEPSHTYRARGYRLHNIKANPN